MCPPFARRYLLFTSLRGFEATLAKCAYEANGLLELSDDSKGETVERRNRNHSVDSSPIRTLGGTS